jgi:hypothetical protein
MTIVHDNSFSAKTENVRAKSLHPSVANDIFTRKTRWIGCLIYEVAFAIKPKSSRILRGELPVQYEDDGRDDGIVDARVDDESAVACDGVL